MQDNKSKWVMIDGSRVLIEAIVQAGANVFIGYPITPANWLYAYASERFPTFLPAPDEISSLQWAAGFATTGKIPATATSFPGFALMVEPLNMAFMMELPMVIILAQRLGPSTGSATAGAQGDILLMRGCISGGYPLPVFCPSNFKDCWELASQSVSAAVTLRTPVILLTSKEMVMTTRSFDLSQLSPITPSEWKQYRHEKTYKPYQAEEQLVPPFLPVGNSHHQVKINASTHDPEGFIRKATPEAIANTLRLQQKIENRISDYTFYEYDQGDQAELIIVTYGITSDAGRDAVKQLREKGLSVSLLILKTLLPISPIIMDILQRYEKVIIAEENASGLLRELVYGQKTDHRIRRVNKIAYMITPSEIIQEVEACQKT